MFHNQRESDGDAYPPTHPSFTTRRPVEMQIAAAACKLEGARGAISGTVNDPVPREVPPTNAALYDPTHGAADWGGMVPKEQLGKKLFTNHASQSRGIIQTEDGIIGLAEAQQWGRKRNVTEVPSVLRHGNQGIIGGISCENRWETEAARFSSGGTRRDQLTQSAASAGRRMPSGGFPSPTASNQPTPRKGYDEQAQGFGDQQFSGSLIGYRAPPQTKSLIANMGASISNADWACEEFKPQISAAASASQKAINSAIPGYTGHRTRPR